MLFGLIANSKLFLWESNFLSVQNAIQFIIIEKDKKSISFKSIGILFIKM